jgi:hypothetical protein
VRSIRCLLVTFVCLGTFATQLPTAGATDGATVSGQQSSLDNSGETEYVIIDYAAVGDRANVVTVSTASDPVGIGLRNHVPPSFVFVDQSLDSATGECRMVTAGVAECLDGAGRAWDSVGIALGGGSDALRVFSNDNSMSAAFRVDAGPGDDVITLIDRTQYNSPPHGQGTDSVDCGDGSDSAVVSESVFTVNCEDVTVVPTVER